MLLQIEPAADRIAIARMIMAPLQFPVADSIAARLKRAQDEHATPVFLRELCGPMGRVI
jgi:hypothetical protein